MAAQIGTSQGVNICATCVILYSGLYKSFSLKDLALIFINICNSDVQNVKGKRQIKYQHSLSLSDRQIFTHFQEGQ